MKVWPIITLGALLYGASYSDGMNTKRESAPHPHRSTLDAEVADAMKAFEPPHRPVTMAFREVFAKLLADQTEWAVPEGKTATAEATDDSDDGQDPGKKLFWTTTHPDNFGVPFPGWGDPNPVPNPDPVVQPYVGNAPLWLNGVYFYTIEDPAPPRMEENAATIASSHATMGNLSFGALRALNTIIAKGAASPPQTSACPPGATDLLCAIIVQVCEQTPAPAACSVIKDPDPIVITVPLGGLPAPIDPTPITAGGGSGSSIGGGGGLATGAVPEPSTWVMIFIGALGLIGLRKRKNRLSI